MTHIQQEEEVVVVTSYLYDVTLDNADVSLCIRLCIRRVIISRRRRRVVMR